MERNLKNAKNELLGLIAASGSEILCAELFYTPSLLWSMDEDNNAPPSKEISLKANHTEEELQEFLNSLDFGYDSGYGGQELFGTVWFKNPEIWAVRDEYDGSEWWNIVSKPEIPNYLK